MVIRHCNGGWAHGVSHSHHGPRRERGAILWKGAVIR